MNNDIKAAIEELDRINDLYESRSQTLHEHSQLLEDTKQKLSARNSNAMGELAEFNIKRGQEVPDPPKPSLLVNTSIPRTTCYGKDPGVAAIVGLIAMGVTVLSVVLAVIFGVTGTIFALLILASLLLWFKVFRERVVAYLQFKTEEQAREQVCQGFDAEMEDQRFYEKCAAYDAGFLKAVEDCDRYADTTMAKVKEDCDRIYKSAKEQEKALNAKLNDIEAQLDAVTIIHPDLFYSAGHISQLLKIGRADTLKEAINLALEEDRKDAEEQARQEEAARQEAILEQQAEDARMHQLALEQATKEHNAAMEREARAHNLAMQAASREQNRLAREQNNIARKQTEFTQADRRRCQKCKNRLSCPRNIHNCGAFVADS